MNRILVRVIEVHLLRNDSNLGYYVELGTKAGDTFKTTLSKDKERPKWNQDFIVAFSRDPSLESLQLRLCDSQGQIVGETEVPLRKHLSEPGFYDEWHSLKRRQFEEQGKLHTTIYYTGKQPQIQRPIATKPLSCSASSTKSMALCPNVVCPQPRHMDPTYAFKKIFMPQDGWNWDSRSLLVDSPSSR